jgi:hypothetical protein
MSSDLPQERQGVNYRVFIILTNPHRGDCINEMLAELIFDANNKG